MKKIIIISLILLASVGMFAAERAAGQLIVWHHENVRGQARDAFMSRYSAEELAEESVLSPQLNIVLYNFNHRSFDEDEMLQRVRQDSGVYLAQFNPVMTQRSQNERNDEFIPNDPGFSNQWHLKNTGQSLGVVGLDTKATYAWAAALAVEEDMSEREIVVAVIDGIHTSTLAHGDLDFWKNDTGHCHTHGLSCPNNPVCDYRGWNGNTNQPLAANHSGTNSHGTIVSGSVAQRSDNGVQGAGIGSLTGRLKILPIHISMGNNALNSEAIASFNYILAKRTLYNETNGQYGAYIVAHNNSWGIDNGWASNYPVWAELYNTLGQQGILATIAIDNRSNINIDTAGDMPGTVTSPWAIKVTNIDRNGSRIGARGPNMVNVASPGTVIWTTTPNNSSAGGSNNTGTSFAAPIVAGLIGLMYQTASEELLSAYEDNPGELALMFKQIIYDGVDQMSNLAGDISTGGRINALYAVQKVIELNEEHKDTLVEKIPFTVFDFGTTTADQTMDPALGAGSITTVGGVTTTFVAGWLGTGAGGRALNTLTYPTQGNAPETAGLMVQVSTAGYSNIHISWNNINSNTGANRTRLQYTIDGTNWINFPANETNATNIRYNGDNVNNPEDMGFDEGLFVTALNNWYIRTADFTSIAGVNDNPQFAVRFVTAFPSGTTAYGATGATQAYAPAGTIRFDNITFSYMPGEGMEPVATPIATPAGGIHFSATNVSLSTETEGASIYFTTDGTSPSFENGTLYTTPIPVSQTTTLRFRAEKAEMLPSSTIDEIYTIPLPAQSLTELRTKTPGNGVIYHLTNEAFVSMVQPDFRNQIYLQDAGAGILIDDNDNVINPTYSIGDGVTGLIGQINQHNGMLQFVPFVNSGTVTSTGNQITPATATFAELNDDLELYQARLVKVYDVLFTSEGFFANGVDYLISDYTADYVFRTNFFDADYIDDPIPTVPVNITGIVSTRNTGSHIASRAAFEIEIIYISVETPEINPPSGVYEEPITVSITCATENVMIYYTTDGSMPDENSIAYAAPFEITQSTFIRAIAFDAFGYNSSIRPANYVIAPLLPPQNINAAVDDDTVTLTWATPSLSIIARNQTVQQKTHAQNPEFFAGYFVYRDNVLLTTGAPITGMEYKDEGLEKDMMYLYRVVAVYAFSGFGLVESKNADLPVIVPMLNPVRELEGRHIGGGIVRLTWEAPEPEQYAVLQGYNVFNDWEKLNEGLLEDEFYEHDFYAKMLINTTYQIIAVYDLGNSDPEQTSVTVSDSDIPEPHKTHLSGNYPNPFNPETTINFSLETAGNVSIEIYNIRGQMVKLLVNDFRDVGHHQVIWTGIDDFGNSLGSGIYFYRMNSEGYSAIRRMILMK